MLCVVCIIHCKCRVRMLHTDEEFGIITLFCIYTCLCCDFVMWQEISRTSQHQNPQEHSVVWYAQYILQIFQHQRLLTAILGPLECHDIYMLVHGALLLSPNAMGTEVIVLLTSVSCESIHCRFVCIPKPTVKTAQLSITCTSKPVHWVRARHYLYL